MICEGDQSEWQRDGGTGAQKHELASLTEHSREVTGSEIALIS